MDGGAWWAAIHGVTQSRTRLSNLTFTFTTEYVCVYMCMSVSVLQSDFVICILYTYMAEYVYVCGVHVSVLQSDVVVCI